MPLFSAVLFLCFTWTGMAWAQTQEAIKATTQTELPSVSSEPDFTWLNGNSRQTEFPLDTKVFTGQFNFDSNYVYDFVHPQDHTLVGSSNSGRTGELQVQQLGIGGDLHYQNIRGRIMTQFGMYSSMTPRGDATTNRGEWDLASSYRYLSEAYAGYHWDIWNGINLDVGLFMSYIGLCSYYNYENWIYQMSFVSSNTPWYFNGLRLQTFLNDTTKIEYWLVNGWQSYGMANETPGLGMSVMYRASGDSSFVTNEYYGGDTVGTPGRERIHTDNSFQYKYFDNPTKALSKAAFSVSFDAGCENGGGVSCTGSGGGGPAQYFLGMMAYNRLWFAHDHHAFTFGGGWINNPGRYLVITPPINGATAANPYQGNSFTQNPGDQFRAWDASIGYDYLPSPFITYRIEFIHREASAPYFAGSGGVTPIGSSGVPTQQGAAGSVVPGFTPDLQTTENRINLAFMVRL